MQMHIALEPGGLSKTLLRAMFDYPFNVCKVNMVIGLVSARNTQIVRFATHIGFRIRTVLEGAHYDGGDILVTAMTRDECRYIR
jgi:RimJ/RimL family protein N-acetyltransferase